MDLEAQENNEINLEEMAITISANSGIIAYILIMLGMSKLDVENFINNIELLTRQQLYPNTLSSTEWDELEEETKKIIEKYIKK